MGRKGGDSTMKYLFDPYPYAKLATQVTPELIESYIQVTEDAKEQCVLAGCAHGAVHCQRELDQLNADPIQFHIDINKHYAKLQAEYYNASFSIN